MIYPTTEEEKRAFYQQVLPGFLEYVRSHMSAIEQVELATVKDGIVSFPATQILGGVQKTVRVPLSMLTADIDEAERQAREYAAYAKEQGDYAKAQAQAVTAAGEYAEEQGDYAKAQGNAALAAKNTVTTWYQPFHDQVEAWAANAASDENQRVANENTRQSQESTRQQNESSRQAAELIRVAAENERLSKELERIAAELARASAELQRKAAEDQRIANEGTRQSQESAREAAEGLRQQTFEANEAGRQQDFEDNEAQRQQDFEDAEDERMKAALLTRFYIDPDTMELHALQVENDDITYSINDEGDMIASFVSESE